MYLYYTKVNRLPCPDELLTDATAEIIPQSQRRLLQHPELHAPSRPDPVTGTNGSKANATRHGLLDTQSILRDFDMTTPLTCEIFAHSDSIHLQQLYTGFSALHKRGIIQLIQTTLNGIQSMKRHLPFSSGNCRNSRSRSAPGRYIAF
jgi:hypothetical protein